MEVAHAGFNKEVRKGLQLSIQQQLVADFDLSVGEVTSEIEVTSTTPILQTENGSVGKVIKARRSTIFRSTAAITRFWRGWFRAQPSANRKAAA